MVGTHFLDERLCSHFPVYQNPATERSASLGLFPFDDSSAYKSCSDTGKLETRAGTLSQSFSSPDDLKDADAQGAIGEACPDLDGPVNPILGQNSRDSPGHLVPHPIPTPTNVQVQLPVSTLTQSRSLYDGFEPPAPETTEPKAIAALLDVLKSQRSAEEDDFLEFDLRDFSVYIDTFQYQDELRPLQHINKVEWFFFDGTLSVGETQFYLKRVPFHELPVGNYGVECHSVGDQIWIRSSLNERLKKEIYYKLGSPSTEYARFHTPFLWIADLAKHVIDYLEHLRSIGRRAGIWDFKSRFGMWLLRKHRKSKTFQKWYYEHGNDDFRGAVVVNIAYIWREVCGVDRKSAAYHHVWGEVNSLDHYRPNIGFAQEVRDGENGNTALGKTKSGQKHGVTRTTVTPYIYDLFSHMSFGKLLESVTPSPETERRQKAVISDTGVQRTLTLSRTSVKRHSPNQKSFIASVECGDVISTPPDDAKRTNTEWKLEASVHHENQHMWYGLVQKIHTSSKGIRSFDVIWLYHPRDTPCGKMKYPWKNELFLSDNCTCHSNMAKVKEDDIVATHTVHWFGDPSTSAQFFVRQTYMTDEQRWATLRVEDMKCRSEDVSRRDKFEVGDAVLVETNRTSLQLENFMIEAFFEEDEKEFVRLRRLLRRRSVDPTAGKSPPNELVYSESFVDIDAKSIARRFLVRVFRLDEKIPAPYDCNGIGDAYFITHQQLNTADGKTLYVPANFDSLSLLRQGFNPDSTVPSTRLRGLDLFCGGGNFGRGLEDGDAIQMHWANDICTEAIHTYMANAKPESCTPFLGSVDDLLHRALLDDRKVPHPGEVQFISGGSPCPGFSLLTNDKTTDKQRKNQSLVASFASYIDIYRPQFGLLENVVQMVQAAHNRDECVFSQLVSAILGLGYQTQILFMDAWSFGAPQSRSRVFLLFTAPGLRVPKVPVPTHSHPPGMQMRRVGLMSNGQCFSQRETLPTPFKFVSAREAVDDLPDIQDAKAGYCVGFPDHRLSIGYTPALRKQVQHIPTHPWEMNFSKAYYGGVMDESTRQLYPLKSQSRVKAGSRGWGRMNPNNIFPTITTVCGPSDARIGQLIHWYQPRPISILEARRAQGFPDSEVLVGLPASQYRIVGNSVARQVARALGLAIREAWFGSLLEKTGPATTPNNHPVVITVPDSSSDSLSHCFTEPPSSVNGTPVTTPGISDIGELTPAAEKPRKRSSSLYVEVMTKKHRPVAATAAAANSSYSTGQTR